MSLSGSWAFTVTGTDIVREAMLNIGAIGESEVPTAQEFNDCYRKLNMIVKQWMSSQDFAPGLKMWERQRASLFLSSNRGIYTLGGSNSDHWAGGITGGMTYSTIGRNTLAVAASSGASSFFVVATTGFNVGDQVGVQGPVDIQWSVIQAINTGTGQITITGTLGANCSSGAYVWNYTTTAQRPLAIVTCVLRDSFNQDIPMSVLTLQDYEALPTKTQPSYQGDPTAYYYESQFATGNSNQGGGQIYLDVGGAQDITKHLHVVYMRPVMDMVNPGDNPEYPQQWYRALCWGLAREICGMFDAAWTQDMSQNYQESVAMAREADAENTSFYFQPYATDPFGA